MVWKFSTASGPSLICSTLLGRRDAGAGTGAAGRADGSAFASSDHAAQNRARSRADADLGRGVLAFTFAGRDHWLVWTL